MDTKVKVALVGIAGYGDLYLTEFFTAKAQADYELVGVVDPMPERCRHLEELWARRIRIHADLPGLYADARPDLVMMATPIHLHAAHTCWCLERGSNVLCEKPLAATVRDARRMVVAEKLASKFVAIGYQWSFSKAVQDLKRDVMAGLFGAPVRLKSIVFFPRGLDYFSRNDWAGKIKTANGEPVFDSPANNAAAHYLHNMFYLLGPTTDTSAMPLTVQAELYRANEIENYDTAVIRSKTDCGAEVLFYTSHAVPPRLGPVARYEFEDAVVSYEAESGAGFIARYRNGKVVRYGEPNLERNRKLWDAIKATNNGGTIPCGTTAAMAHTQCIAAAQMSMPQIQPFPQSMLLKERQPGENVMICVSGLHAAMVQCYDQAILPHEHGGLEWAVQPKSVQVKDIVGEAPAGTAARADHVVSAAGRIATGEHFDSETYASAKKREEQGGLRV